MLHLLIKKSFFYKYLNGRGEIALNLFILIKCLRVDWEVIFLTKKQGAEGSRAIQICVVFYQPSFIESG